MVANTTPATAVGNAKGRSIKASKKRLAKKLYRTMTHAIMNPKKPATNAAIIDVEKLTRKEAIIRGWVMILM